MRNFFIRYASIGTIFAALRTGENRMPENMCISGTNVRQSK